MLGFALFGIVWLGSLPTPSCKPPKPSGEYEEKDKTIKKDCPSVSGAIFIYTGHFIHDNRDEITTASTAIIAIFTTILGIFTIRLAGSTRIAADAAKLSAQAAINVELPRLFETKIDIELAALNLVNSEFSLHKISITITNYGRTPAFLYCQSAEMMLGPLPQFPFIRTLSIWNREPLSKEANCALLLLAAVITAPIST